MKTMSATPSVPPQVRETKPEEKAPVREAAIREVDPAATGVAAEKR
jgi:hypothetical protein